MINLDPNGQVTSEIVVVVGEREEALLGCRCNQSWDGAGTVSHLALEHNVSFHLVFVSKHKRCIDATKGHSGKDIAGDKERWPVLKTVKVRSEVVVRGWRGMDWVAVGVQLLGDVFWQHGAFDNDENFCWRGIQTGNNQY